MWEGVQLAWKKSQSKSYFLAGKDIRMLEASFSNLIQLACFKSQKKKFFSLKTFEWVKSSLGGICSSTFRSNGKTGFFSIKRSKKTPKGIFLLKNIKNSFNYKRKITIKQVFSYKIAIFFLFFVHFPLKNDVFLGNIGLYNVFERQETKKGFYQRKIWLNYKKWR